MERRQSFLTTESDSSEKCILCDSCINAKDKQQAVSEKNWHKLVEIAKTWSFVDVPYEDRFYQFKCVHRRICDRDPFGKVSFHSVFLFLFFFLFL